MRNIEDKLCVLKPLTTSCPCAPVPPMTSISLSEFIARRFDTWLCFLRNTGKYEWLSRHIYIQLQQDKWQITDL